jgi:hypothetical protein
VGKGDDKASRSKELQCLSKELKSDDISVSEKLKYFSKFLGVAELA